MGSAPLTFYVPNEYLYRIAENLIACELLLFERYQILFISMFYICFLFQFLL